VVETVYDDGVDTETMSYAYDARGNRTRAETAEVVQTFTHDRRRQMLTASKEVGGTVHVTTYEYDLDGALAAVVGINHCHRDDDGSLDDHCDEIGYTIMGRPGFCLMNVDAPEQGTALGLDCVMPGFSYGRVKSNSDVFGNPDCEDGPVENHVRFFNRLNYLP